MSVFEKESDKIKNDIAKIVRKLSILTIEHLIQNNVMINKEMNIENAVDEAINGAQKREGASGAGEDGDKCEATLVSGANKGNKCSNKKSKFSQYCARHMKMMEKKKEGSGKKERLESIVFGNEKEAAIKNENIESKIKNIGNDYYLLEGMEEIDEGIILTKKNGNYVAVAILGKKGKPILLSSKAKIVCLKYSIKSSQEKFNEVADFYKSMNE
jgi:hypothetical protein